MKISKVERLILANQFRLLSMIEKDDISKKIAKNYSTIFLKGYEVLYKHIFEDVDDISDSEKYDFVLEVLDMYRIISNSYRKLSEKNSNISISEEDIVFQGFDANHGKEYYFAQFYIEDYDRYTELTENKYYTGLNSHDSFSISIYKGELSQVHNPV